MGKKKQALYIAGGTVLGILILMFFGGSDLTHTAKDQSLSKMFGGGNIMSTVLDDRTSLMKSDIFRSILFLLLAGGLVWAYLNHKIKGLFLAIGITLITIVDVWTVSKRVASDDKFEPKTEVVQESKELPVDQQIKSQEKDIHYRVLDLTNRQQGPFQDARASKYHKSVGGYFAAKLMLFEEMKNKYLGRNPLGYKNILGMMNTKWLIAPTQGGNGQVAAFPVAEALGNAWFVPKYEIVANSDEELNQLEKLQPKQKALINPKFKDYMNGFIPKMDSTANIALTSYHPDKMEYTYSANAEQLAVFSEMYYKPSKGWKVYLNGESIEPFIRANYILRAMRLPAGQNMKLEMRFEPQSYYLGKTISQISSITLILFFLAALFFYFSKNPLEDPNRVVDFTAPKKEVTQKTEPTKAKISTTKENKKKPKKK